MRLRAVFFAIVAFAVAGAAAWKVAEVATARYEAATADQVEAALAAADQGWAAVATDGLKVTLTGAAPDETSRFRVAEIARQVVDARRVEDLTTLAAAKPLPPAPFALELLRNEADVSLIGLVPQTGGRDVIRAALRAGGLATSVTDMLESASDPAPDGWQEALGFSLSVLSELPRAKISVAPKSVRVVAVADSDDERARLEDRLQQAKPEGVTLILEVSAPRAVIAPFAFDFSLQDGVGRMDACSAATPDAAAAILAGAKAAGLAGDADCPVGLGSPSSGWPVAVSHGLEALRQLGGGRFTLSDMEAELTPPEGAPADKVAAVAAKLDAALPDLFRLATKMPEVAAVAGEAAPPPEFEATLSAEGAVRLAGMVTDATSRDAILSYAAALFGHDRVMDTTEIARALPGGWPGRVLAAVEALAALEQGKVVVTPEKVAVDGSGLEAGVSDKVAALLASKVDGAAEVHVTYDAAAAAAAADAAQPKPELCADQINAILAVGSIQFSRGSADIVPESKGVIAAIADVLRGCPGADFEIGGHTDSQGSAEANQRLSDERAQAVLAALRAEDLPHGPADRPRLRRRAPARGQRQRGGTGDATGGSSSPCCAGGRRRTRPEPERRPRRPTTAEVEAYPARPARPRSMRSSPSESIQFAGGAATWRRRAARSSRRSAPRCAAARTALRDRRLHRFPGLGEREPAPEPGARRRGAGGAARPGAGASGWVARGYGEADPVADNATADGRAQNRRIAFTPLGGRGTGRQAASAAMPRAGAADAARRARRASPRDRWRGSSIQFAAGSPDLAPARRRCSTRSAGRSGLPGRGDGDRRAHRFARARTGNERLSQRRAEAVLAALRERGLALPQADGARLRREPARCRQRHGRRAGANRRIAFSALVAEGDAGCGGGRRRRERRWIAMS